MGYQLQYGQIAQYIPYLLGGALVTLQITFLAFAGGLFIGVIGAAGMHFGGRGLERLTAAYVVFFTNTPQLAQVFFLFYVLPGAGILLSPYATVAIAMTINAGAYLTRILRAGFVSVRQEELDAAVTLGMSTTQLVRHVILPHIVRTLFAPLSNQFILMILGSSMAAIIGVNELTGRAYNINAETFRTVEIFSVTAASYVVVTLLASLALAVMGRVMFRVKLRVV